MDFRQPTKPRHRIERGFRCDCITWEGIHHRRMAFGRFAHLRRCHHYFSLWLRRRAVEPFSLAASIKLYHYQFVVSGNSVIGTRIQWCLVASPGLSSPQRVGAHTMRQTPQSPWKAGATADADTAPSPDVLVAMAVPALAPPRRNRPRCMGVVRSCGPGGPGSSPGQARRHSGRETPRVPAECSSRADNAMRHLPCGLL